jgi:hypothetical protein
MSDLLAIAPGERKCDLYLGTPRMLGYLLRVLQAINP